jgi:hypothetical protein
MVKSSFLAMFSDHFRSNGTSGQNKKYHLLPEHTAARETKSQFRSAIATTHFAVVFALCYIPLDLFLMASVINPVLHQSPSADVIFNAVATLALLNSLLNPILYVWKMTECRMHFLLLVCPCSKTIRSKALEIVSVSFLSNMNSARTTA